MECSENSEELGTALNEALHASALPRRQHVWIADNDWQDMVGVAKDAVKNFVLLVNDLQDGDQLFKFDLEFGGELCNGNSQLILAGQEDKLVKIVQTVLAKRVPTD
jgi:hypothetical protein